jgi:hypothetical protein
MQLLISSRHFQKPDPADEIAARIEMNPIARDAAN